MARFLTVGICAFVCFYGIIGEPQCSPFHYHEQLLERMIDVKYKMDALSTKMEKWESVVPEKLEKIDELQRSGSHLIPRLEEGLRDQATHLKTIGELKVANVLFKARDVKRKSSLTKGETVIFQTIVQNEGQGYDTKTGVFTAPTNGTYLFTVQFCLKKDKELSISIVADGNTITVANFGDPHWNYMSSSTEGFAILRQGNRVEVQVTYSTSGDVIYSDSIKRYWSYFSGVLLHI